MVERPFTIGLGQVRQRAAEDLTRAVLGWGRMATRVVGGRSLHAVPDEEIPYLAPITPFPTNLDRKLTDYNRIGVSKTLPELLAKFGVDAADVVVDPFEERRLINSQLWINENLTIKQGLGKRGVGANAALAVDEEAKADRERARRRYRYHLNKKGADHVDTQTKLRQYQRATLELFDKLNVQNQERMGSQIEVLRERTMAESLREKYEQVLMHPKTVEQAVQNLDMLSEERGGDRVWNKALSSISEVSSGYKRHAKLGVAAMFLALGLTGLHFGLGVNVMDASKTGLNLSYEKLTESFQKHHIWGSSDIDYAGDLAQFDLLNARMAAVTDVSHQFGKSTSGKLTAEQQRIISELYAIPIENEDEFQSKIKQYLPDEGSKP